jgi:hypothetical protein
MKMKICGAVAIAFGYLGQINRWLIQRENSWESSASAQISPIAEKLK